MLKNESTSDFIGPQDVLQLCGSSTSGVAGGRVA